MSKGNHHSPNDQRSDVKNPNNPAYEDDQDNRANQLNPNNEETKEQSLRLQYGPGEHLPPFFYGYSSITFCQNRISRDANPLLSEKGYNTHNPPYVYMKIYALKELEAGRDSYRKKIT